jgi:hypothetical protein
MHLILFKINFLDMKKRVFLFSLIILSWMGCWAQVGINTDNSAPDPSAGLDVNFANKGLLPPRITLSATNSATPVASPATGLLVYNTAHAGTPPNNVFPGYYFWNGTRWIPVAVPQGTNVGDMLYWNGTQYIGIPAGANGQVLTINNGIPAWGGTQLPILNTAAVTAISATTATSGGNSIFEGGSPVTLRGVCWNTSSNPTTANYHTSDGSGNGAFVSNLTGLTPNTLYYVRAYATNTIGTSYAPEVSFTTMPSCGSITVNHLTSGGIAPVDKTVTYGTVTNIPGEPSKCWITSNLGADYEATSVSDGTEPPAGWYWQFNIKQGYKHDGAARTPNIAWITSISEDYSWQAAKDPCALELGLGWRIPLRVEWTNVDAAGGWTNWNGPWSSGIKLHAAGFLYYSSGLLEMRGLYGTYWSGTQSDATNGWYLGFESSASALAGNNKAYGLSIRCLRDL